MYNEYWKLSCKPFDNVSDVRFMYYSEQHREALARLLYAVREKKSGPFVAGPYRVGKTMVRDILIGRMGELATGESRPLAVSVENPVCGPVGMLQLLRTRIAEEAMVHCSGEGEKEDWSEWRELSTTSGVSPAQEFNQLHRLLNCISAAGRHVVEAQEPGAARRERCAAHRTDHAQAVARERDAVDAAAGAGARPSAEATTARAHLRMTNARPFTPASNLATTVFSLAAEWLTTHGQWRLHRWLSTSCRDGERRAGSRHWFRWC